MAIAAYFGYCYAQEPVLSLDGELYFIPASMTKDSEAFLVDVNNSASGKFTIYDGDFNVVKAFTDPTAGLPYQERIVTMTCVVDPNFGPITRAASDDWTVIDDQTRKCTTGAAICSFELYSDNNNYHSRNLYVSQTLFDDDDEFEYVRQKQTIVPITTKYSDYLKEHSTNSGAPIPNVIPSYGNEKIDSIMRVNEADHYENFWDETTGKYLLRLYKHETYGGIFTEGLEIATLDGNVKAYLPNVTDIYSAYYFRGKCYVQGYSSNDNSRVLYQLGNGTTDVKEISRSKVDFAIRRVSNNLVVDSETNEPQTIVMSTVEGRVVRSLATKQGHNIVSLNGLISGIYNVTLYRQSKPVSSKKMIIK